MKSDWDENAFPLAYLLTFRTYGTWHHGDNRGSVDRKHANRFGTPKMQAAPRLVETEIAAQQVPAFVFDVQQRAVVNAAIREVCVHRGYVLHALNIRSNHGHAVVTVDGPPEKVVEAFKSYATRALRAEHLVDRSVRVWARHASTRYLWKDATVTAAIDYVLYSQGDEFPNFDSLVGE